MVMDSENHKKRMVSIDQEISNLLDMQNMLVDEKAEEMQKYVDELMEIQHKLQTQRLTQGNETRIRHQLGTIGRQVKKKFSYRKIGGYIADDFRYQHDFLGDAVEEGEEIEMVDVLGPSEDAKGVEEMIVHEEPFVNEPEETPREEALDEEINEDEETLAESETALDEGKE